MTDILFELTPEQLEIDLDWIENEIGDRPYGVDMIVPAKYAGDEDGGFTLADIAAGLAAAESHGAAIMTTPEFRLHRNAFGRLELSLPGGVTHMEVTPVRASPIAAPERGISLMGTNGHELLWIDELAVAGLD